MSSTDNLKVYVYQDIPLIKEAPDDLLFTRLLGELQQALRENSNVCFIDVNQQINRLAQKTPHTFEITLGIGSSGYKVAQLLNKQTGMFPDIKMLSITRKEISKGMYKIVSSPSLAAQLEHASGKSLALVDDTIYSGQTLEYILKKLPLYQRMKTQILCLQAVQETSTTLRAYCPVLVGFEISGKIEKEVTIIKFSGLFEKGAIRSTQGELAFYQREEWMRSWFPHNSDLIIVLCRQLSALSGTIAVHEDCSDSPGKKAYPRTKLRGN